MNNEKKLELGQLLLDTTSSKPTLLTVTKLNPLTVVGHIGYASMEATLKKDTLPPDWKIINSVVLANELADNAKFDLK